MKLQFEDYAAHPQPQQVFENPADLDSFLEKQRDESMMCQLISESGYKLQIGIDGDIGCAQFLSNDNNPPYFMAVTPVPVVETSHDFDMTGSATEVSSNNCLPFDLLKRIVLEFLQTGQMSDLVEWEEV